MKLQRNMQTRIGPDGRDWARNGRRGLRGCSWARAAAGTALAVACLLGRAQTTTNLPPTVIFVTPFAAMEGQTVELFAGVIDPNPPPDYGYQFLWRLPDGTLSTNARPVVTFDDMGTYSLEVYAANEWWESAPFLADIVVSNSPPQIQGFGPLTGAEGEALTFSATVTDAGRTDRHRYEWTFPDGAKSDALSPTRVFSQPGSYPVSLVVRELGKEYLYNNSRDSGPEPRFYANTFEAGDELILGGTNRVVSEFRFLYYGDFTNMSPAELSQVTARVRFYAPDGPPITAKKIVTPGTLLYESDPFPLQADYNWKTLRGLKVEVGAKFMWSFLVENLPQLPGKQAGTVFYHSRKPTATDVGKSYDDFWRRQADGAWALYRFGGNPVADFGTQVIAISSEVIAQTEPFVQNVVITNVPPVLTGVSVPQNGLAGTELRFAATASDPGEGVLTYAWSFGDGAAVQGPDVTHTYAVEGQFAVRLTVNDLWGGTDSRDFPVNVTADRRALRFSSAPLTQVTEDQAYQYAVATIEPGPGQTLQITAPVLPAWLQLTDGGDGTAVLAGQTGQAQVGVHQVTLRLSDGTSAVVQSFAVVVVNVNDPPTIQPVADQSIPADTELAPVPVSVSDPDNPAGDLALSATSSNPLLVPAPSIRLGGAGGARTVSIRPAEGQSGTATIMLTVSDGLLSASTSFTLTVTPQASHTLAVSTTTGGEVLVDPVLAEYPQGMRVTLTARASAGYAFAAWSGDASGTASPLALTMDANKTVQARFQDMAPPAIVVVSPPDGPTPNEVVSLTGTVQDNVGVATIQWEREGVLQGNLPLTGGQFNVTGIRLLEGENNFRVIAVDVNGNTSVTLLTTVWAPGVVLTVQSPREQREGKLVDVPIKLTSQGDVGGLSFTLSYDDAYLGEPEMSWSSLASSSLNEISYDAPGLIRATLSMPGTALPGGVQTLATLRFRVRSIPFNRLSSLIEPEILDVSDVDGRPLASDVMGVLGETRLLQRRIKGDCNANDRLDVGDAHVLQQMITNPGLARTWDLGLNDLNGNNRLDAGDVTKILLVVVGKEPQPKPQRYDGSPEPVLDSLAEGADPARGVSLHTGGGPRGVVMLPVTTVKAGDRFTAQVKLENLNFPITGASFWLHYPGEALQLVGTPAYRAGAIVPKAAVTVWNDVKSLEAMVGFAATSTNEWTSSNGVLAEFTFAVAGTVPNRTDWAIWIENLEVSVNGYENSQLVVPLASVQTGTPFPPSQIQSLSLGAQGELEVKFKAEPGQRLLLERSTDLVTWAPYLTLPPEAASARLNDPALASSAVGFFRIKAFPPTTAVQPGTVGDGR